MFRTLYSRERDSGMGAPPPPGPFWTGTELSSYRLYQRLAIHFRRDDRGGEREREREALRFTGRKGKTREK